MREKGGGWRRDFLYILKTEISKNFPTPKEIYNAQKLSRIRNKKKKVYKHDPISEFQKLKKKKSKKKNKINVKKTERLILRLAAYSSSHKSTRLVEKSPRPFTAANHRQGFS